MGGSCGRAKALPVLSSGTANLHESAHPIGSRESGKLKPLS